MQRVLFVVVVASLLGLSWSSSTTGVVRTASPPELVSNVTLPDGGVKAFDVEDGIVYMVGDFGLISYDTQGENLHAPVIISDDFFNEKEPSGYTHVIVSTTLGNAILVSDTGIDVINILSVNYTMLGNYSLSEPVADIVLDESSQMLFVCDSTGLFSIDITTFPLKVNQTRAFSEPQHGISYSTSDEIIATVSDGRFSLLKRSDFFSSQGSPTEVDYSSITKAIYQTRQRVYFTTTSNIMFVNKVEVEQKYELDGLFEFSGCLSFDVTGEADLVAGVNRSTVYVYDSNLELRSMSRIIGLNNIEEGVINIDARSQVVSNELRYDHLVYVLDTHGFQVLNGSYVVINETSSFPWLLVIIGVGGLLFLCIVFHCCRIHLARSRNKSKDFKKLFRKNYGDPSASVREMEYYESR
eukprot:TRINITY_DN13669_c0_g1_i1.p1 TRINITY_DN13669_c0_g1~~TRINITY_DN13669_c0_g1_i1.p1  ORF type:complete len:426 (+),score=76.42 TRINITY_DN13669_c0_g1_i1:47-1279(+)